MNTVGAFISETFADDMFSSTYKHTTSVKDLVKDISIEEFTILISLASNALRNMKQSSSTLQYKEAIDKEVESYTKALKSQNQQLLEKLDISKRAAITDKESAIESLESKHTKEILNLKTQLDTVKSSLSISESAVLQIKGQFADISTKSEEVYKISLAELSKQKDTQYTNEIARIESMNKERFSQYESQHKEGMTMLTKTYSDQENKLKSQLEQTLVSSEIGKYGELEFEELVEKYTRWGPLTNTSKIPHSGDSTANIKGCSTIFEIKRYTTDVPTKEVEKFIRDIDEHPEVPLGIFISQKSNITGKKSGNFIQTAWTPRSQLLVYVNTFNNHSPQDVLSFIDTCADIALRIFKLSNEHPYDSELSITLQSRIDQVKCVVDREARKIVEFINSINIQKKSLIETITKHHTENNQYIHEAKLSLKTIVEILIGKSEEDTPITEETLDVKITERKRVKAKQTKGASSL
jgi:hypothetical protein